MIETQNFGPQAGQNYRITGTGASSANAQITQPGTTPAERLTQALILNETAATAYIATAMSGTATATASGANSFALGAGQSRVFNVGAITSIAAMLGVGTATGNVLVSMGSGS